MIAGSSFCHALVARRGQAWKQDVPYQPEDLQTTSNVGRRRWQRVRRARAAGGKEIWSEWTQTAGYVG